MKIAIDLQPCQSGSRLGGIGRYSIELAKAMVRRTSRHSFTIVLNDADPVGAAYCRGAFVDLLTPDSIRSFSIPRGVSEWTNDLIKVRAAELIREQFLAELSPDFVHVSSLFEGLQEDIVTSVGLVFPAASTAVTLYDLIPLVQRERYLTPPRALDHYLGKVAHAKRAGLLLAISEYSRREAVDLLGVPFDHVVNISSAADARFRPIKLTNEVAEGLRQRHGINRRFLMYTGSFDQRKNHPALIQAFGLLPSSVRAQFQLLIVGKGWDGMYQQLRAVAKQAGLQEDAVVFAGHVADADLVPLYNLCDLFVFPSMAEGFGLPVLEAMSCGTPTICSNTTSLPEVIGLQEATFDPTNPKLIAATMHRALTDDSFRQYLRIHGLEQAKLFSWDESARRAIDAIETKQDMVDKGSRVSIHTPSSLKAFLTGLQSVADIGKTPDAALQDFSRCLATNRTLVQTAALIDKGEASNARVGWVSTWNTRCGIAAYSRFLIEHWPSRVSIFAPYVDWTTRTDEENVCRCWRSGTDDDLEVLYRQITGERLRVLVIQFNYGFFEFDALARLIERLADAHVNVTIVFHSTNDPAADKQLVYLSQALRRCRALVVHTQQDIARFESMKLCDHLALLPQGVPDAPATDRSKSGCEDVITIGTYGFALPHKGLLEVVQAFMLLRQQQKNVSLRLLMVNAQYPVHESAAILDSVRQLIDVSGAGDAVTLVTDFLPDEQSLALLQQTNLVVFAYQHTGESSSAAVRMGIASGTPVAVTPLKIFDDVCEASFTLPGVDVDSLASGISEVLHHLSNGTVKAETIRLYTKKWRQAHKFKGISKELFLLATKPPQEAALYDIATSYDLSAERRILIYSMNRPPLKTAIGEGREDKLVTTARSGHLLYGPFISADGGRFRATLTGSVSGSGSATLDVSTGLGAVVLAEKEFSAVDGKAISLPSITFVIPEGGGTDLEVRLKVDDNIHIELAELKLEHIE